MAAAIKMDELLVSWLGSDTMYENVLHLIEEQNKLATKQQQQQHMQQQLMQEDDAEKDAAMTNADSSIGKDSTNNADDATASTGAESSSGPSGAAPRCVIPRFYLGDQSRPRRRRRLLPVPQSDTWEPLPENEQEKAALGADSNADNHHLMMVASQDQDLPDGNNNVHGSRSALCVRDHVMEVYRELGHDPPPPVGEEEVMAEPTSPSGTLGQRFITVHEFVRITKDICRFPTFFNAPLFQRIIWLHQREFGKKNSASGKPDAADVSHSSSGSPDPLHYNPDDSSEQDPGAEGIDVSKEVLTFDMMEWFWKQEMEPYDAQERFFRLCKQPNVDYIVRDDFLPYIKALLTDHPGLEFLSNHAEFQEKYAVTVITRIFYRVNKCHSGRITCRQIRRSDLLEAFQQVDEEEDINKVTRYFSYEHFYVLYCRFWELDHDRDYRITREDLLKYGDHSLSHMIVDRIFDAAPRPFEHQQLLQQQEQQDQQRADQSGGGGASNPPTTPATQGVISRNRDYLSYEDFIYFMLSEEDKANGISVRYWFSCVDVDGDGRLNNMEMRSFYAVQLHRMQCMGHEIVPFEDMLCQMMDMIKPSNTDFLVVEDFLQPECAPVAGALFDALFNLNKYLMFEQRDPFVERQKREDEFETDWDRFACIDYNRLAMEEEAREEEAMEIDWVTVDDEDDDVHGGQQQMHLQMQQQQHFQQHQHEDFMGNNNAGSYGGGNSSSEAPF